MAMLFVFSWLSWQHYLVKSLLLEPSEHNSEELSLSSQGSWQEGETLQEWQSTPQVKHKLRSLNNFLGRTSDRSVSPARSQCKSEVLPGAHYWEPAIPIMSQCSDIFTDQCILRYFSHEIGQFQSTCMSTLRLE